MDHSEGTADGDEEPVTREGFDPQNCQRLDSELLNTPEAKESSMHRFNDFLAVLLNAVPVSEIPTHITAEILPLAQKLAEDYKVFERMEKASDAEILHLAALFLSTSFVILTSRSEHTRSEIETTIESVFTKTFESKALTKFADRVIPYSFIVSVLLEALKKWKIGSDGQYQKALVPKSVLESDEAQHFFTALDSVSVQSIQKQIHSIDELQKKELFSVQAEDRAVEILQELKTRFGTVETLDGTTQVSLLNLFIPKIDETPTYPPPLDSWRKTIQDVASRYHLDEANVEQFSFAGFGISKFHVAILAYVERQEYKIHELLHAAFAGHFSNLLDEAMTEWLALSNTTNMKTGSPYINPESLLLPTKQSFTESGVDIVYYDQIKILEAMYVVNPSFKTQLEQFYKTGDTHIGMDFFHEFIAQFGIGAYFYFFLADPNQVRADLVRVFEGGWIHPTALLDLIKSWRMERTTAQTSL